MNEEILTIDQVCQLLSVKKSWVYRWSHEGRLPKLRISSRCVRFRRSDIEKWLKQHLVQPVKDSSLACRANNVQAAIVDEAGQENQARATP